MNSLESSPETSPAKPLVTFGRALVLGVLSLGFLAWIIQRNGGLAVLQRVADLLHDTWPFLLVPYAAQGLCTLMAMRTGLPDRGRLVPLWALASIEQSASALGAILPFGVASGDLLKLALLRPFYRTDQTAGAMTWVGLATGLCHWMSAAGPVAAGFLGVIPWHQALLFASAGFILSTPTAIILAFVTKGLVLAVARQLVRIPIAPIQRRSDDILAWCTEVDAYLVEARFTRRRDFLAVVAFRAANQVFRVAEIWVAVTLLGYSGGLLAALLYHAMSRVITTMLGIVPGRLGVMEFAAATLFPALGYPATFGIEVALALRFTYVVNALWSGAVLAVAPAVILKRFPVGEPTPSPFRR